MQSLRIVLTCVVAAISYGILHDQVTAHLCVEYFSIFHPPVFPTQSPALLALGWGVLATWWIGASLGIFLALAARAGSRKKIDAVELVPSILKLLAVMGGLAAVAGLTGYVLATRGMAAPPEWIAVELPPVKHARFVADSWAHQASYATGFVGGIVLSVLTFRERRSQLES
jgi:hypothetical protein